MILSINNILERNYMRLSTSRFVVDSPRFWRKEFNPRFKDLFEVDEFKDIFTLVNNSLAFPLDDAKIGSMSLHLYDWLSGYRFNEIPQKNPSCTQMFLSDLYFHLMDVMNQISFVEYPLTVNDFNLVTNTAETAKNDRTKVGTDERNKVNTRQETDADMLINNIVSQRNTTTAENVDEESKQNTKIINDVFLSPQDQGVSQILNNEAGSGVNGITIPPSSKFTTNTANQNTGDTTQNKTNTSAQGQEAETSQTENNDIRTKNENANAMEAGHVQENTAEKTDRYSEHLDYNKGARLQDWYNLNKDNLFLELLQRLTPWILQVDIATSDINYVGCQWYE